MDMNNSRLKNNLVIVSLLIPISAVAIALPDTQQGIETLRNMNTNNLAGVTVAVNSIKPTSVAPSSLPKKSKCLILTQTIEYQSTDKKTNKEVTKLQQFLYDGKFLSVKPDGFFGLSSVAALRKYQYKSRIPDVGSLDAKTRKKIQTDTCTNADINALTKASTNIKKAKLISVAKGTTPDKVSNSGTFQITTTIVETKDDKGNIIKKTVSSATEGDKAALGGEKVFSSKEVSASESFISSSEKLDPKAPFKILYPQGFEKIEPLKSYVIQWSAPSMSIKSKVRIALVNVKKDEISRMDEGSLIDPLLLDVSTLSQDARAISADVSGIPETIMNRGGYTWSVPAGIPTGTGYRIYIGNPETGIGSLNESNFWITSQTSEITKARATKIQAGYLVNLSGRNFVPGSSVKFTKNGRLLLNVDSQWVQVIGSTQIQLFLRDEDMFDMPAGGFYSVAVFDNDTKIESESVNVAF